jgi:hypothetical protein
VTTSCTVLATSTSIPSRRISAPGPKTIPGPVTFAIEDQARTFDVASGFAIFGSDAFSTQLRRLYTGLILWRIVPETRVLDAVSAPSCDVIRSAVIRTFQGLSECHRRRIFVYALRGFSNVTGREIASITGRTPSAVTHDWRALQARMASDISFRRQIEMLAQVLGPRTS